MECNFSDIMINCEEQPQYSACKYILCSELLNLHYGFAEEVWRTVREWAEKSQFGQK